MRPTIHKRLVITDDHLKLLSKMQVGWQEGDYGAPEINPKRPYGNSYVEGDICEILGWKFDKDRGPSDDQCLRAANLHREMEDVLQVCLVHLAFRTGVYVQTDQYNSPEGWVRTESVTPI